MGYRQAHDPFTARAALTCAAACLFLFSPCPARAAPAFSAPCPTAVARRALESYFRGPGLDQVGVDTAPSRPLFVTLAENGRTRGCAGSFQPLFPTLGEEVAYFAVRAATRDFRRPSMTAEELEKVTVTVFFPGEPVAVASLDAYDPLAQGLMVSRDGRRGVVLPRESRTVSHALRRALADAGLESAGGAGLFVFDCLAFFEEERP